MAQSQLMRTATWAVSGKGEIFSDEFERKHTCKGCGIEVDFTQCTVKGESYDEGVMCTRLIQHQKGL